MRQLPLLALLLASAACDGLGGQGTRPEGTRLLQLSVPIELTRALGTQSTALQLAAVVVRPDGSFTLHTSTAIDPASETRLSAFWPVDESYSIVVQIPSGGGVGRPGGLVAQVRFADGVGGEGARIPAGEVDIDLGSPSYEGAGAPASALLRVDDAHNPLAQVDSDGDGLSDLADGDDDEDGTADEVDEDRDGDGALDADQALGALEDADANGVPDIFE